MKNWAILPPPPEQFLTDHPELPPLVARLLWNRHLTTQEKIDEFLNPDYSEDIHDPFLFKDMEKACEIIFAAIAENKNIMVHGDYDADGVSASVIIISALKKLGAKKINAFLPHREIDGYGLNMNTIKIFEKQKIDLIITCDCGISNLAEIKAAHELGMQIIITDHHTVPAILPPADAIIHPLVPGEKYPDKGLAGGAVAFKMIQGLLKKDSLKKDLLPDGQTHEGFEKWLLDLVAIASIGDMVPLFGESRTLTRYGLTVMNKTRNLGLKKIMAVAGLIDENDKIKRTIDAQTVAFQIVPRINAAGRMDHANTALALLLSETDSEAKKLAEQLNKNNQDRQKLTEQLVKEARNQIESTSQSNNSVLFIFGDGWGTGILGLVAGKIKDEYYRPVIVMGFDGKEITGSGRSISEFNLIGALQKIDKHFLKYGGHPQACGFSLKDKDGLENFKNDLLKLATEELKNKTLTPSINIDTEVDLEEINWKMFDLLEKFSPFGQGNNEPTYAAKDLTVIGVEPVGQDGRHLRLMVKHRTHAVRKTIGFGLGNPETHPDNWKETLKPGNKIDMVFSVGVNEWNGNRELQITIEDIKKSTV